MKRILCIVLALITLCLYTSCVREEETGEGETSSVGEWSSGESETTAGEWDLDKNETPADFTAESDTLFVAYVYVEYVDGDGFAGSGTFRDGVYVAYPGADEVFGEMDTVRIEFYGRDHKVERKTSTDPHGYTVESAQTITKVQSARLSDYAANEPVYD